MEQEDYRSFSMLVGNDRAAFFYGDTPIWSDDLVSDAEFTGIITIDADEGGLKGYASRLGWIVSCKQGYRKGKWESIEGPRSEWRAGNPFLAH